MSDYNDQQQPPVGVPPLQGDPPEGYPKDAAPPPPPRPLPPAAAAAVARALLKGCSSLMGHCLDALCCCCDDCC